MINTKIHAALAAAEKHLKLFKRASQDCKENGWRLEPEEWWDEDDESALRQVEAACAELRGEKPLFDPAEQTIAEQRARIVILESDLRILRRKYDSLTQPGDLPSYVEAS